MLSDSLSTATKLDAPIGVMMAGLLTLRCGSNRHSLGRSHQSQGFPTHFFSSKSRASAQKTLFFSIYQDVTLCFEQKSRSVPFSLGGLSRNMTTERPQTTKFLLGTSALGAKQRIAGPVRDLRSQANIAVQTMGQTKISRD